MGMEMRREKGQMQGLGVRIRKGLGREDEREDWRWG